MKKTFATIFALAVVCLSAAPALADSLGEKIAQRLCLTGAESVVLSDSESAQYDATETFVGQYRIEKNGAIVTAKFIKTTNSAACEKSSCHPGGGDCPASAWPIAKEGNMLKRTTFSGTE